MDEYYIRGSVGGGEEEDDRTVYFGASFYDGMWACEFCNAKGGDFSCYSFDEIVRHLAKVHQREPQIICS